MGATFAALLLLASLERGAGISCYTCSSVNGTDPHCHDPFHPAYAHYTPNCMVPKEGHIGRFPGHFCIKLIGRTVDTNSELVIRICSLENMDNSCGVFRYQEDVMQGCILTCNYDGCNGAPHAPPRSSWLLPVASLLAFKMIPHKTS